MAQEEVYKKRTLITYLTGQTSPVFRPIPVVPHFLRTIKKKVRNGSFVFRYDRVSYPAARVKCAYETERSHRVHCDESNVGGRMRVIAHGGTGNASESD